MPPWAFPLRGFLLTAAEDALDVPFSPLALCRFGRTLASPLAPQGIICRERSRSLSRPANPLAAFHLVILLDALATSQDWVMGSPQRQTHVAASPILISTLQKGPRPELAEKSISVTARRDARRPSRCPLRRFSAVRAGHGPSLNRASSHRVCLPLRVF